MKDLSLHETGQGGELAINGLNSDIETIDGVTNEPYLSWFGGNLKPEDTGEWWGNAFIGGKSEPIISTTEKTMQINAIGSKGRALIEEAANNDLSYIDDRVEYSTTVTLVGINKINIRAKITERTTGETEDVFFINTSQEIFEEREIS